MLLRKRKTGEQGDSNRPQFWFLLKAKKEQAIILIKGKTKLILNNVYQIIEPFSDNINSFIRDDGNVYKLFNNRAMGKNIEIFK